MYYYQPRISDNSLNCFHYGNNFLIEKNMVKIYYDSELLEELPRKQKLSGHLICLSEL